MIPDPRDASSYLEALNALRELMQRLRDPISGCPWDRAQTFATIAPYTIEEAYEVAEAIQDATPQALCEELGDLLFQVLYHAKMAEEQGWFDLLSVMTGLKRKIERRHLERPRVMETADPGGPAHQPRKDWEALKAEERRHASPRAPGSRFLDGLSRALPPLRQAVKIQERMSIFGFDWNDIEEVYEKINEEIIELREAADRSHQEKIDEFGDLLFSLVNLARHLGVDPEYALVAANKKFTDRVTHMEASLSPALQRSLETQVRLSTHEWALLWQAAKEREKSGKTII
jgi:nucleoside triphosphate diphosphatase